jgi:hypothetical protein
MLKILLKDEREERLVITSSASTSGGKVELKGKFRGSAPEAVDVYLGEILLDKDGRLIFLGGRGVSNCVRPLIANIIDVDILSEFDNLDWYDDVCDGRVRVTITKPGSTL